MGSGKFQADLKTFAWKEIVGESNLIAMFLLIRVPWCLDGIVELVCFFFSSNTLLTALMLQLHLIGNKWFLRSPADH